MRFAWAPVWLGWEPRSVKWSTSSVGRCPRMEETSDGLYGRLLMHSSSVSAGCRFSLLLMALMKNAWIPIVYGISPPPLLDGKDMLCESTDTGVLYPTETAKREYLKRA